MNRLFASLVAVVLLLPGSVRPLSQSGNRPDPNAHVVIISLDGFPSWALDDPYLSVPTLRKLAARGALARRMHPTNPTVTWPNHTSMITGVRPDKHQVLYNGLLVRTPGLPARTEPWRDKVDMVKAPTLYDVAHGAGLTTAQVDWVAIWNAPTITWEFREVPAPDQTIPREMIQDGVLSADDVKTFNTRNIVWRDEIWTQAAEHIIRKHRPNLLLFHLLTLDSTHHQFGTRKLAAWAAMAHLDDQVGRIVKAVEESGLSNATTFFVVSDHGFKTVKRQIRANAALAQAGLITLESGKITGSEAYVIPEGGTAFGFITRPDPTGELLRRAKAVFAGLEGVEKIVEPSEYAAYGLPAPRSAAGSTAAGSDQIGEFFLVAKDGYAFTGATDVPIIVNAAEGSLGAHGYVATDPEIQSVFIAAGRGIRPGTTIENVDNIDVGPTAARLLGLDLGRVDGRVLSEVLVEAR